MTMSRALSSSVLTFAHTAFSHYAGCQARWAGVLWRRCLATNVRKKRVERSQEERDSRKEAKEKTTVAHTQFPFLPTGSTKFVYVLDKELARDIATAVVKNQDDPSTPILETNPGPGVLTKALIEAGAKSIVLTESLAEFMPHVKSLEKDHERHIQSSYNVNYIRMWQRLADPDAAAKFEGDMMSLFPPKPWTQGPPVSVLCILPQRMERGFLSQMILSYSSQHNVYGLGRPEWFLTVSAGFYFKIQRLESETHLTSLYGYVVIILHLMFDIRLCAQLPCWKFTPHFPSKRAATWMERRGPELSFSHRYLLHLRPKVDQFLTPDLIPLFYSFLVQLRKKTTIRLIPKMEQLVPGCGPRLIQLNITMMCLISDIKPQQYVQIFKALLTWPEFSGSPLKHLLTSGAMPPTIDHNTTDHSAKPVMDKGRDSVGASEGDGKPVSSS